jgi:hypothetical protein
MKLAGIPNITCFSHSLRLAIDDALRSVFELQMIVLTVKHNVTLIRKSNLRSQKLLEFQKLQNTKQD